MYSRVLIWLFDRALSTGLRPRLQEYLTKIYKDTAKEDLHIKTEIVRVKKGKRRYTLAIFETPEGKLKFNLGRYLDKKEN